jgi:hypothetical protein
MELHATRAEVVEHRYPVAKAAAQPVELPDHKRVAVFQFLQAAAEGKALRRGSGQAIIPEYCLAPGFLQRSELHGGILVVGRDAGIAVFHRPIFEPDI